MAKWWAGNSTGPRLLAGVFHGFFGLPFFRISQRQEHVILIKLHPFRPSRESLGKIDEILKKYAPALVLEYRFMDDKYAKKFGDEERISTLWFFRYARRFYLVSGLVWAGFVCGRATHQRDRYTEGIGRNSFQRLGLLFSDFVVLIGFVVTTPVA